MPDQTPCPVCGSSELREFFAFTDTPVYVGVQWPTAEAARSCPRADIRLGFCRACGFIGNLAFDPAKLDYEGPYDNALDFSPRFQEFIQDVARGLMDRYDLRDKTVAEIGCGHGGFLSTLCRMGDNRGYGFDPSSPADAADDDDDDRVTIIRGYYSRSHVVEDCDLLCCRQVLEHIERPLPFLRELRETVGDRGDTVLYFDVPNARLILRDLSVWTVIYEHCSYFSAESLVRLFRNAGFDVLRVEPCWDEQFLALEARPAANGSGRGPVADGDLRELEQLVESFRTHFDQARRAWRDRLDRIRDAGTRVVAWGAGARTVGLFNALNIRDEVPYAVDINPRKHGLHLAGTGQRIVGPAFLREYRPQAVILMNPVYEAEIREQVSGMGLDVEYLHA